MATYTLTDLHRNAAELVNEARFGGQPVIITDHGKPAAAVIPPDLLAHYQRLQDEHDLAEVEKRRARGAQWLSLDEANRAMDEIDAEFDTEIDPEMDPEAGAQGL